MFIILVLVLTYITVPDYLFVPLCLFMGVIYYLTHLNNDDD